MLDEAQSKFIGYADTCMYRLRTSIVNASKSNTELLGPHMIRPLPGRSHPNMIEVLRESPFGEKQVHVSTLYLQAFMNGGCSKLLRTIIVAELFLDREVFLRLISWTYMYLSRYSYSVDAFIVFIHSWGPHNHKLCRPTRTYSCA